MKNKRRLLFRIGAVAILVAVAACMMVIGRGHTVYFDNKAYTAADGQEYPAFRRAEVYVNGERVARLSAKERGLATCMGQQFSFSVEVTANKGDDPVHHDISLALPYGLDGIVVNLPAYLAGLPQKDWQSVFVPQVFESTPEDEEIVTDEFDMGGDA